MSSQEKDGKKTVPNHDEDKGVPCKRIKSSISSDDIPTLRRRNFIKACEIVSQKAYFNYAERLQLIYMPVCTDRRSCRHNSNLSIKEIPLKVTKLIEFEMEASNWCGALEVCIMSITHDQYLSDVVLKHVVGIMLNAHEYLSSGYTISQILDKCKLVLTLHFSTHCPCLHDNLREVYTKFLTSSMENTANTKTIRREYGSENGIVNFCFTRLEHELDPSSKDGALFNKTEYTPENFKQTVKGLFYEKKQFDIFEMLDRTERINRLMTVLHSVIELLQFDLAIWQSIRNSDTKIRGIKTLMASVLQHPHNCFVTTICTRILTIFAHFVHLEYPEEHIKTMTLWLNAIMEYFYMNGNCPTEDYPSPSKFNKGIILELFDIIRELPPKSILNILERIKPAYLRHQLSNYYSKTLLSIFVSDEKETLNILTDFLKEAKWNNFPSNENNLILLKKLNVKRVKPNKLLKKLSMICNSSLNYSNVNNNVLYPKFCVNIDDSKIDQSFLISILYITLQSFLEAYGIQSIQETLMKLNENLMHADISQVSDSKSNKLLECKSYSVTHGFIKKYRHIFRMLKELILTMKQAQSRNGLPKELNIFDNLLNLSVITNSQVAN